MVKGEIWWAQLPYPRGSEPAKKRPVLVIQGDAFNRSSINTVICAVITTNQHYASSPEIYFWKKLFQNCLQHRWLIFHKYSQLINHILSHWFLWF